MSALRRRVVCVVAGAVAAAACTESGPRAPQVTAVMTPAAFSVPPNESVAFTFTFRDADDNAIANAPVSLSSALASATFTPPSGTTNDDGEFTSAFRATTPGSAPITAMVGGKTAVVSSAFSVCAVAPLAVPASVGGSISTGQCVSGETSNALFSLDNNATSAISLTVSSVFDPAFAITTELPQDHIVVLASQQTAREWILPPGTFQVRLGAAAGSGSFSLATSVVPGNSGCVERYLATAVTIVGQSLSAGDCDFGDGTHYDAYGIYSSRQCSIRLQSIDFTPYLWLYNRDTSQINGTTGVLPGNDAVFGLPACKISNGPIFIWVNSDEGESGGNYGLIVVLYGDPASGVAPDTVRLMNAVRVRPALSRRAMRELRARARMRAGAER